MKGSHKYEMLVACTLMFSSTLRSHDDDDDALPRSPIVNTIVSLRLSLKDDSILQFVDGWELNGSYFPNDEDYSRLGKNRFHEYCGKKRIKEVLESSQNAALITYVVPEGGKGFSFYFTTRKNPTRKLTNNNRLIWNSG